MKSYQVLLPHWLEKHIKQSVTFLDISFSEVIRLQICISILTFQNIGFPEYKAGITLEYISDSIKKMLSTDFERDEILQLCSEVYFETRKALEYRDKEDKKVKKK